MANYQPINSLDALSRAGSVPLWLSNDALAAIDRGGQADQSSLAHLMAQQSHEQRMNPLKERSQVLANQTSEAQLPGLAAQSEMHSRKNKLEAITFDDDVKAKLREAGLKATEQDLKELDLTAQRLMLSRDPREVAEGTRLWQASKHMQEERFKADNEMKKARLQADTQRYGYDKAAESRIAAANISANVRKALSSKDPKKLSELLTSLNMELRAETDPIQRQEIKSWIDFIIGQQQATMPVTLQPQAAVDSGKLAPQPPRPVPAAPAASGAKPGSSKDNPIVLK